ncbi:MAG: hypothetical protein LH478_05985 [Chitinophagaceae bacterium]|nr:hypothetical protein [Chitinophagaceae bacterium]
MKSRFAILCILVGFLFTSCFEIEEKTTLTSSDGGNFSLTIDMSKLLAQLKVFGGAEQFNSLQTKDTTISFRNIMSSDTLFSAPERELLADGSMQLNMNADKDQMKAVFSAPFKSLSQVADLRKAFFKLISQSGKNAIPNMPESASIANSLGMIDLNSLGFTYKAGNGSISNLLTDSVNIQSLLEKDSLLQQVKMIGPMLNIPSTYKQVFTFTKPVTTYSAANGTLSTDKKSIIIKNDFQELFDNPRAFEYSISY